MEVYSPPYVDGIWGKWGSDYNIPKAIFYLLKGDYIYIYIGYIGSRISKQYGSSFGVLTTRTYRVGLGLRETTMRIRVFSQVGSILGHPTDRNRQSLTMSCYRGSTLSHLLSGLLLKNLFTSITIVCYVPIVLYVDLSSSGQPVADTL